MPDAYHDAAEDQGGAATLDEIRRRFGDSNSQNLKMVVGRLLDVYPQLKPVSDQAAPDLVWKESEAILGTIQELVAKGIPALPTHDSVLIGFDVVEIAKKGLAIHYRRMCGVRPMLKTKRVKDRCSTRDRRLIETILEQAIARVGWLGIGLDTETRMHEVETYRTT